MEKSGTRNKRVHASMEDLVSKMQKFAFHLKIAATASLRCASPRYADGPFLCIAGVGQIHGRHVLSAHIDT